MSDKSKLVEEEVPVGDGQDTLPEDELGTPTDVIFSADQVEDMASQLQLSAIVVALNESQETLLSMLSKQEERIVEIESKLTNAEKRLSEFGDFAADAEHIVGRANGFAHLSEDIRQPELEHSGLLKSLTFGRHHDLLKMNQKQAPIKSEDTDTDPVPAPTNKRTKHSEEFLSDSERVKSTSTRMSKLWFKETL